MRKMVLIVLMLLGCLLLTGCYTDADPWPAASTPPLNPTTLPGVTSEPVEHQING